AIGTVERPVPSNLPKPSPGMDPDVLLREFLKGWPTVPPRGCTPW
ncbi:lipoprotein lpqB, partial [Mycobacterium tuberculosis TB_RSA169]